MANDQTFSPVSFDAFDPVIEAAQRRKEQEQLAQIPGGFFQPSQPTLLSQLLAGAPAQAATPAQPAPQTASNGTPAQSLLEAAQRDPSIVGKLLSSSLPGPRAMGQQLLAQMNQPQFNFQMTPDGTMVATDSRKGTVTPVYQSPKPKQFVQTADGAVVAVDPVSGSAQPVYQGGPKLSAIPPGYEPDPNGGIRPIKNGPQDSGAVMKRRVDEALSAGLQEGTPQFKQYVLTGELPAAVATAGQPKPLPSAALSAQNEDLDAIQAATTINGALADAKSQIETGKLALGPLTNFISSAKNWAGNSDDNSKNYASFLATLEKIRNDSLRLNKGVQTEGDAQRAWNELFNNLNDPKVVGQRIEEITALNQKAIAYRQARINQTRSDYGQGSLDASAVVSGVSPQQKPGNLPVGAVVRQNGRTYRKQADGTFVEAP